jgi:beta-galactosidase
VPYEPGVLRAVGKRRDGTVACEAEIRTAGPPSGIRLSADRDTITTRSGDVALIRFEIVDSAGIPAPTAGHLVRFGITGGAILALDNADLRDHAPYRSDRRRAFNGRGVAIVSAPRPGPVRLTASATGLEPASVSVRVIPGAGPEAVAGIVSP